MVNRMETVASKLPKDLAEQVEEYREQHELNKSQAIRRLVEDGLEADRLRDDLEERRDRAERTVAVTKPAAFSLIGWFMIALSVDVDPVGPVFGTGVAVVVLSFAYAMKRGHM